MCTSHSQNDLENVPSKKVCYAFDNKRVCVAWGRPLENLKPTEVFKLKRYWKIPNPQYFIQYNLINNSLTHPKSLSNEHNIWSPWVQTSEYAQKSSCTCMCRWGLTVYVATGSYNCNFIHLGFHRPRSFMEMMIPLSLEVYQFQLEIHI